MELHSHLRLLRDNSVVKEFIENALNPIFGINYKNKNRVSFKLYSEIDDINTLKNFDNNLYESIIKFIPLIDHEKSRSMHIGLKLKDNKINNYFHFKLKKDVYYFSNPFSHCSYQGASIETDSPLRPYFYYENNSEKIKKLFNVFHDVPHIEYAQTKTYKKVNIGTKENPFDSFVNLDSLAYEDSNILEKLFNQKIITSGRYDDGESPTIAVYYYDCLRLLNNI